MKDLSNELDKGYFVEFEKYISSKPRPMDLETFMKLEMAYYHYYQRRKRGLEPGSSRGRDQHLAAS